MDQEITDQEFLEKFGAEVQRDFTGTVLSINGDPVEGASVNINNKTAVTNAEGVFTINDTTVREQFAFITVESLDYFNASNSMVPTSGINNMVIRMIPKIFQDQVQSGVPETVVGNSFSSVTLRGNYITEDGSTYNGLVNVATNFLYPSSTNLDELMPGMLLGRTENDDSTLLKTYGMVLVELQGENGEHLNLAENSTATITMAIDPDSVATAPSTIPLWSFDEEKGYWKEEGEAALVGEQYIGEVSHFSFWSFGLDVESLYLTINVITDSGIPIANNPITLISEDYGQTQGFTDNLGQVTGLIPANESLQFRSEISLNTCESITFEETIGSFSVDNEITIVVPDAIIMTYDKTVTGLLLNCSNEPVTNGYVIVYYLEAENYAYVTNGSFSVDILQCADNTAIKIIGYDLDTLTHSEAEYFNLGSDVTDVGTITTCENVSGEYVAYKVENGLRAGLIYANVFATIVDDDFDLPELSIGGNNEETNNDEYSLKYAMLKSRLYMGEQTGSYPGQGGENSPGFDYLYIDFDRIKVINPIITITSIGEVGEYIDVTLTGEFTYDTLDIDETHTIEAEFHVLRDE